MVTTATMTMMTTMMTTSAGARQRGAALILVLWTFAVLTVLATEFARAMRDDALATRNFKQETSAHYTAIAAMNEVLLALMARRTAGDIEERGVEDEELIDPVETLNYGDGVWVQGRFAGIDYEVRAVDEAGKIGINAATEEVLDLVFQNLGYEGEVLETLTDSIIDWRDADDLHRVNGAEDQYYESLPRPYSCKDGAFDSIEELLLVRGVTEDIYYGADGVPGLADIFTVFNPVSSVNLKSATPAVMIAVAGIEEEEAQDLRQRRAQAGGEVPSELSTLFGGSGVGVSRGASRRSPTDMTVEARVRDEQGRIVSHIGAVMHVNAGGDGFYLLRWYDSLFSDEDDDARDPEGASEGEAVES